MFLTLWGLVWDLVACQSFLATTDRKGHPADFSGPVGGGGLSRYGRQRTETVNLKTGSAKLWGEGRPALTYTDTAQIWFSPDQEQAWGLLLITWTGMNEVPLVGEA